jgi:magnesium chelatase family protein
VYLFFDHGDALPEAHYRAADDASQALMTKDICQLQLTAHAYQRALKLSRTIADLTGSEAITQAHLAEALQYRPKLEVMQTSLLCK